MDDPTKGPDRSEPVRLDSASASELNNLIQIVSGTVALLENIWEGTPASEKYFEMLRESVGRAAKVTSQLVQQAGGADPKILLHPALGVLPREKPAPPPAPEKPRCILVVDDEPMALSLSKAVLIQDGFVAVTAQSGFEALDLFRKHPGRFALVLLDLRMPLIDGEEVFHRLRIMDPRATILLNTGFIEQHQLDRMMASGLSGFLRRPYTPNELIEQIEIILARVPEESPTASPFFALADPDPVLVV